MTDQFNKAQCAGCGVWIPSKLKHCKECKENEMDEETGPCPGEPAPIDPALPEPMPPEIAVALVKAQAHAHAVEKSSQNSYHQYRYASAESIVAESRGALAEAGLGVLAEGWHLESTKPFDRIVVQYLIVHSSGSTWRAQPVSTPVIPEKGRPQDKAEATALTYNLGYFQRGLLNLPRVEEGTDVDQRDDSRAAPARQGNGRRGVHDPDEVMAKGKHKGTKWRDLEVGYLQYWIDREDGGELQDRSQAELDRRQNSNGDGEGLKARLSERKSGRDEEPPPAAEDPDAIPF